MAGPVRLLHLAFAAAVTPSLGRANFSAKNFEPGWLSNYDGNLGAGYRVRLTLTASQNEVSGLYFYASQLKDIRIAGWISEEKLALNEFDKDGRITARFEGAFADRDPRGVLKGILRCEVIVGNWHGVGAAEKLPFYLHLDSATAGSLSRRYGAAGAPDDELVHRNTFRFWQAVVKGDKAAVAALIDYPIHAKLAGDIKLIRHRQELISSYDVPLRVARCSAQGNLP